MCSVQLPLSKEKEITTRIEHNDKKDQAEHQCQRAMPPERRRGRLVDVHKHASTLESQACQVMM